MSIRLTIRLAVVAAVPFLFLSAATALQAAERSGKEVVDAVCATCHATGEKNAPRIGDRAAWTPRLSHGLNYAVNAAIRGHGGMPARGGAANLTDSEVRNAVIYMFNPGTAAPVAAAAPAAPAKLAGNAKIVGTTAVYLGFLPAEVLRAYPKESAEQKMHGGVPSGSGNYHVNVSVLDTQSKQPVTGASVAIRVEEPGLSSESKNLQPITFNDVPSYGQYVKLKSKTQYVVTVTVQRPDLAQPVEARFEHRLY
ncbi:MAG TPA: c-type cytochrome [Burkholderiaceae bacterium]|nr:c-type cytochrome [Burkholderiaceae bacterium]